MKKKPHIIATVGPACENILQELQDAGVAVFRLNFSHGDYAWSEQQIKNIRALKNPTKIMLDTKGPEIRTGVLSKPITLETGDRLTLINKETAQNEENRLIYCTYLDLPKSVKPGDVIQLDNGKFSAKVTSTHQSSVVVELLASGILGSRRHVNLPGVRVNLPTITEKDKKDIAFGVNHDIDMVALSFARDARDIRNAKALVPENVEVVAKIESQEGIDNFRSIARAADGIMIARGDLGVEMPVEQIPVLQRKMLHDLKKDFPDTFAIVATGMLRSMIDEARPRRAEVTDIATATWEGADYCMLSDETAAGQRPIEAVEMFAKIIDFSAKHAPKGF